MDIGTARIGALSDNDTTNIDTTSNIHSLPKTKGQTFGEIVSELYEQQEQSNSLNTTPEVSTGQVDEFDLSSFATDSETDSGISGGSDPLVETVNSLDSDMKTIFQKLESFFSDLGSAVARTGSDVANSVTSGINNLVNRLKSKPETETTLPGVADIIITDNNDNNPNNIETIITPEVDASMEETPTESIPENTDNVIDSTIETVGGLEESSEAPVLENDNSIEETITAETTLETETSEVPTENGPRINAEVTVEKLETNQVVIEYNGKTIVIPTDRLLTKEERDAVRADTRATFEKMIKDLGLNVVIPSHGIKVNEEGNVMIEFSEPGASASTMQIIYNLRDLDSLENILTYVQGDTGGTHTDDYFINKLFPQQNDYIFMSVKTNGEGTVNKYSDVAMKFLNTLANKYQVDYKYAELSGWSQGAYGTAIFFNNLVKTLDDTSDMSINIRLYGAKDNGSGFRNYLDNHSKVLDQMVARRVVVYAYEEDGIGGGGNDNLESKLGKFVDKGLMVVKVQNASMANHPGFVSNVRSREAEGHNIRYDFADENYTPGPYSSGMRYMIVQPLGKKVLGSVKRVNVQTLASIIDKYKNTNPDGTPRERESEESTQPTIVETSASISDIPSETTEIVQTLATTPTTESETSTSIAIDEEVKLINS